MLSQLLNKPKQTSLIKVSETPSIIALKNAPPVTTNKRIKGGLIARQKNFNITINIIKHS